MNRTETAPRARREVLANGRRIAFGHLIVATSAQHACFGHDEWATSAPGLKTIDDATGLRRRILLAFEKAEAETDPAEHARYVTFQRGTRLITGVSGSRMEEMRPPQSQSQSLRGASNEAAAIEATYRLGTQKHPSTPNSNRRSTTCPGIDRRSTPST